MSTGRSGFARIVRFWAGLVLAALLLAGPCPATADPALENELRARRIELVALERHAAELRDLIAAAGRGEILLRDDRLGLVRPLPRDRLGELARMVESLPAAVRPLARPQIPPGTSVDALIAALAVETRALVARELEPTLAAIERSRSQTVERIARLEEEIARRAEEARLAAERARAAEAERARIEAERQRLAEEKARLEAERRRVEEAERTLAETRARLDAELARTRAAPPPPPSPPGPRATAQSEPAAALAAGAPVAARRVFERIETRVENESVTLAGEGEPGLLRKLSFGRTPEGFVLFDLWLDRERRLGSFVCDWSIRGLDEPLPPGGEVAVQLAARCTNEAGPPLPVPILLRVEADGLEIVADRRRGPVELWVGTRGSDVRLEASTSFRLRAPLRPRPGELLRLRLVQPGCCTPFSATWRLAG
ncbi:MAG: hypothetical protein NZ555_07310 [Geminicoccaceae bacterium]|nr:hypothetical protein [Geminicoccaceae bacterium]MCX8101588.1 hypothetical protein [Geminicoccaceae bacterium]MDW8369865.1 hypothetical protein [Geminicoccaceae bacterium]